MFNISLILLIIGILLIISGYSLQVKPPCNNDKINIQYLPRNIYDEIIINSTLKL